MHVTMIAVLGVVGLFLLDMTIMTDRLKAMAGSAPRTVLSQAAATPLSGAFRGAIVTLLVQSYPAALVNPVIAIEAARRAVANVLETMCVSIAASLSGQGGKDHASSDAIAALEEVREFPSELKAPPEAEAEQERLTYALRGLDHASRLAEMLGESGPPALVKGGPEDIEAAQLCKGAMRWAGAVTESILAESALSERAGAIGRSSGARRSLMNQTAGGGDDERYGKRGSSGKGDTLARDASGGGREAAQHQRRVWA